MKKDKRTGRGTALLWAGLAVLLGVGSACMAPADESADDLPPPGASAGRKNFILLVIDTLRVDRIGAYGSEESVTPAIDELAARSIVYRNTFAQSSWTKTSMASLFTGLYPSGHLVVDELLSVFGYLPEDPVTLAEAFQAKGYVTVALSGNPHISRATGFDQGFSSFHSSVVWFDNTTTEFTEATSQALAVLAQSGGEFFLYAHYLDPHDPWKTVEGCDHLFGDYKPAREELLEGEGFELSGEGELDRQELLKEVSPTPLPLTQEELGYLETLYDCEVLGVDRAIGELMAELERLGLSEETVIVLTADHGEEFFDHGLLRHGYQLYNETVTVPLIVHLPNREQSWGTQVEAPVALLDVFPTLVALAELEAAHGDGHVLPGTGVSASGEDDSRTIWGMTRFRNQDEAFIVGFGHKLIWDAREGSYLLYDLETDPDESTPLAVEESRAGQLLRGQLDEIVANLDEAVVNAPDRGGELTQKLSDEQRRALRALGYID